jgi:hypothetical protein
VSPRAVRPPRSLPDYQRQLEQGVVLLCQSQRAAGDAARRILHQQWEDHDREWVFPNPAGRPWSRHYVSHVFRKAVWARTSGEVLIRSLGRFGDSH